MVRFVILAAILLVALVLPTTADAQIDQFSFSPNVQRGPEGASATAVVTVQCTNGFMGTAFVNVVQNNGGRLASGFGANGFTCTGAPQTVSINIGFSIFALKQGKATATASVTVTDPTTFESFSQTLGPLSVRVYK
jgi:hypothetical protein